MTLAQYQLMLMISIQKAEAEGFNSYAAALINILKGTL